MKNLIKVFENLRLRTKILILIIFINIVTTLLYTYFSYDLNKDYAIKSIDERLKSAVHGAYNILNEEYHNRIFDKNSISSEEYLSKLKKLSLFSKELKVAYVYSMIKRENKVYFTSSSASDEDIINGEIDEFFDEYSEATEKLKNVFDTKLTTYEQSSDEYGTFRSILIPFTNKFGETYIVGADIDMSYVNDELQEVIINSILIGIGVFIFAIVISIFLINFIVKKIPIIEDGLINFFKYLNREIPKAELIEMSSNDEFGKMSKVINENIEKIRVGIEKDNKLIDNITHITESIKRGSLKNRIKQSANNPSLNRTKDVINEMLDSMEESFDNFLTIINAYSKQDYTYTIDKGEFVDEFAELIDGINKLGKDISSVILKNAYDSLSLQRDSNYLKEYIDKITLSANESLSNMRKILEFTEVIKSSSDTIVKKIEAIEVETKDIKSTIMSLNTISKNISLFIDEIELSRDDRVKANTTIKDMQEAIYDINLILSRFDNFTNELFSDIKNQYEVVKEIDSLIKELYTVSKKSSNMTQDTNLVAIELAKVSNRIREDVVSKNFVGKDNIMIFLQYIDR